MAKECHKDKDKNKNSEDGRSYKTRTLSQEINDIFEFEVNSQMYISSFEFHVLLKTYNLQRLTIKIYKWKYQRKEPLFV